jgi:hypothetical protein
MESNAKKHNVFLILIGGLAIAYAFAKLLAPVVIEGAGVEFHVWNLELRGTPAVVVSLGYAALGLVLLLLGLKGSSRQ